MTPPATALVRPVIYNTHMQTCRYCAGYPRTLHSPHAYNLGVYEIDHGIAGSSNRCSSADERGQCLASCYMIIPDAACIY